MKAHSSLLCEFVIIKVAVLMKIMYIMYSTYIAHCTLYIPDWTPFLLSCWNRANIKKVEKNHIYAVYIFLQLALLVFPFQSCNLGKLHNLGTMMFYERWRDWRGGDW